MAAEPGFSYEMGYKMGYKITTKDGKSMQRAIVIEGDYESRLDNELFKRSRLYSFPQSLT